MGSLVFIVPGVPVPKGRPRFTRTGHCYTPAKTASYENAVRVAFLKSVGKLWKPVEGAVQLSVNAYYPMPKSMKATGSAIPKTTRPDLDNLVKAVMDSLNKVAWKDDCQVWKISALKTIAWLKAPSLTVEIFWEDAR